MIHLRPTRIFWCALTLIVSGCITPPTPAQQVSEVANELNLAARFGRMDVAADHTMGAARKSFLERRRQWGRELRVVDVELSGMQMEDEEHAKVQVDIAWVLMSEGVLHSTQILQNWELDEMGGGWKLRRERRAGGDLGLFGEKRPNLGPATPHPDVQFPTKTIRAEAAR